MLFSIHSVCMVISLLSYLKIKKQKLENIEIQHKKRGGGNYHGAGLQRMFLLFGSATCSTYTMYYCVFLLLTASYTPRRESNDLEHGVKVFRVHNVRRRRRAHLQSVRRLFLRRVPLFNRHCAEQNQEFPAWIQPDVLQYEKAKNCKINRKKTHGTLRCICIEPCHNRYLVAM